MSENRIKISDHRHIYQMGAVQGIFEAVEKLEALPANLKSTPGMALAMATINAQAHMQRAAMTSKNLIAVAKAKLPIEQFESIDFDPNTAELVCNFYEPDLFTPEAPNDRA